MAGRFRYCLTSGTDEDFSKTIMNQRKMKSGMKFLYFFRFRVEIFVVFDSETNLIL